MILLRSLLVLTVFVSLTGCAALQKVDKERYERNKALGSTWLSDQLLAPEINVAGNWNSPDWGRVLFVQSKNKVTGYLGDYKVDGVVSGKKAFLLLSDGGWNYHSAVLEKPSKDVLIGYTSRSVPYEVNKRAEIRLDRF